MGKFELVFLRFWVVLSLIGIATLSYKSVFNFKQPKFDVIDVERINVREADGTLRMVISNKRKQDVGNVDGIEIHKPYTPKEVIQHCAQLRLNKAEVFALIKRLKRWELFGS